MHNPSYYAWVSALSPDMFEKYEKYVFNGTCSLCGNHGSVIHVKRVVSNRFTNWEDYSNVDKPAWCQPCTWSFNGKDNRSEAFIITANNVYTCYQVQSLKPLLNKPLDTETSMSVSLKKAKHVLPYTTWGKIKVEDASLPWTSKEVKLEHGVSQLVELGFSLKEIRHDDSPPVMSLMKLSKENVALAYMLWDTLSYLRGQPHLFNFIVEINKKSTMDYTTHIIS